MVTYRCQTCDGQLTPLDSAALAERFRAQIDENHRVWVEASEQWYTDQLELHGLIAALRSEVTPRQAQLLANWWRRQMPDRDGDTWVIAENYELLAEYRRRPPYDPASDARAVCDEFWTSIDPDGAGRAGLDAWRDWTGVSVDELADAAADVITRASAPVPARPAA